MLSRTKLLLIAVGTFAATGGIVLALNPPTPSAPPVHARLGSVATTSPIPAYTPPAATAAPRDERFVIKRILPIEGAIKYGEWHWNETGAPAGPIVVTVDLEARVLSVFRGGYEIGAAAVLIGSEEKPTPTGVFPITQKKQEHYSSTYDDAPMPFMQRLTSDGVALHATDVKWGYASHGCVGMPLEFARRVFGATQVGDKVYITEGKKVGLGDLLVES